MTHEERVKQAELEINEVQNLIYERNRYMGNCLAMWATLKVTESYELDYSLRIEGEGGTSLKVKNTKQMKAFVPSQTIKSVNAILQYCEGSLNIQELKAVLNGH